jgi:hypothetical protein
MDFEMVKASDKANAIEMLINAIIIALSRLAFLCIAMPYNNIGNRYCR